MTEKQALAMVIEELDNAVMEHPQPFHSRHEGYAIIQEEVDELWTAIKSDQPTELLYREAAQVAAMSIQFLLDIC